MNGRLYVTVCLVFAAAVIFTGCRQEQQEKKVVLSREPNLPAARVPSGYEARAIEATGGLNLWKQKVRIQLDCVVTFYQPDGSFYLTTQQYAIYPWSGSIEIFGSDSSGDFAWRLSQGQFEVLRGGRQLTNTNVSVDNKCFAEAILNIVTAPVRLFDNSVEFYREPNPVRIQGLWYYPLERRRNADIESLLRIPKAVFYQNRETAVIEMIQIACLRENQFLIVRGYDYNRMAEGDVVIPHRIEIFLTDSQGYSQKQLAKFILN